MVGQGRLMQKVIHSRVAWLRILGIQEIESNRSDGYRILRREQTRGPTAVKGWRTPSPGRRIFRVNSRVQPIDQVKHRFAAYMPVSHKINQGPVTFFLLGKGGGMKVIVSFLNGRPDQGTKVVFRAQGNTRAPV